MDEGDVPYVGLFCACGLLASEEAWAYGVRGCPECYAAWPERLVKRYPHDGRSEVRFKLKVNEDIARVLGLPCDRSWVTDGQACQEDVCAWVDAAPEAVRTVFKAAIARCTENNQTLAYCHALLEAARWERTPLSQ